MAGFPINFIPSIYICFVCKGQRELFVLCCFQSCSPSGSSADGAFHGVLLDATSVSSTLFFKSPLPIAFPTSPEKEPYGRFGPVG